MYPVPLVRPIEGEPVSPEQSGEQEEWGDIQPPVQKEIADLQKQGFNVRVVRPEQEVEDPDTKGRVQHAIDERIGIAYGLASSVGSDLPNGRQLSDDVLERRKEKIVRRTFVNLLFDPEVHPAGAEWLKFSKRAVALGVLYGARDARTISDAYATTDLDAKLFDGKSAAEVMEERGNSRLLPQYREFFASDAAIEDDTDQYGLTSADYLRHVVDSYAVRDRGAMAREAIVDHFSSSASGRKEGINMVSLGCGAADPIYATIGALERNGLRVDKAHLIDGDPVALAAAKAAGEDYYSRRYDIKDLGEKIKPALHDLLRDNLTDRIDPQSADVVDLLGLFEYFPAKVTASGLVQNIVAKKLGKRRPPVAGSLATSLAYNPAADLLGSVRDIMRPGGMIVFGNMLKDRPDQEFFDKVWPKLEQRSIGEVLDVISAAGYNLEDVEVDVPEGGVYAVYKIKIPETQADGRYRRSAAWQVGRRVLGKLAPRY
ncbi:hypothetical protein CR970_04520 [Candidatus Saccharibacteria bacterium]|nr:MAG: hypothetical protein CR970_04520 [Candidatus Saccharibacteria bacterium]